MIPQTNDYLDGNAAAGELSKIFAIDVTAAEGQCAHCGTIKHFADAHLYMEAPGMVARCAVCEHVLLRMANGRQRVLLDMRGLKYLSFDTFTTLESGKTSRFSERPSRPSTCQPTNPQTRGLRRHRPQT